MTDALRIPDHLIAEVKRRTDVRDLVARRTRLTRQGGDMKGLCVFHKEKSPSLHAYPDHYHCFGCGAHGSAIDFVMETEGLTFVEAVAALADEAGVPLPDHPPPKRKDKAPEVAPDVDTAERARAREESRRKAFHHWWRRGLDIRGSVAETYLAETRGIRPPFFRDCPSLAFLPDAAYWHETAPKKFEIIHRAPALLACLTRPDGAGVWRFAGVQLTYLQPDGSDKLRLEWAGEKLPAKKTKGDFMGGLVCLTGVLPDGVCGEGVETTLSVVDARNGAWAGYVTCGTANMAGPKKPTDRGAPHPHDPGQRLPPEWPDMTQPGIAFPAGTERVTFLGDGDTKDLLALESLLKRAVRRQEANGLAARYVMSPVGVDFNDLLMDAKNDAGGFSAGSQNPSEAPVVLRGMDTDPHG